MSTLPVYYEHLVVGEITLAGEGPAFAYDPRWPKTRGAFPVSLGMPLGGGAFGPEALVNANIGAYTRLPLRTQ
ncbi:HipA N-terminal domain-containing protein (plasmid) [Skermanella rosea]|uniref:HipA N-terminal domain-containing protein n=1 Tax=Skermanella rosea TaxID=1817965 RepID=UPI001932F59E|nr:HipA N-terminal domain-containing protein [Skermanella rosea]UEM07962.1 HipA N-terminal domain-containing protein [Skermanella rosea]